ncbi:MAG TPA: GNAT family N-acetyltransferase [Lentisphaeria bacterium]|jgi:phosphinothricin acetyltransferase|nr:GNAT family N-acetyltransferase [Lentisphaeria bacterium]
MTFCQCTLDAYGDAVLAIINHEIATSDALYETELLTIADIATWFEERQPANLPVIGVLDDLGGLVGFGSYGPFRGQAGFSQTVEHSLYVRVDARRHGIGRALLRELISHARTAGYRVIIGALDSRNHASCRLHESEGFSQVGLLPGVARKADRSLDLVLYQFTFDQPESATTLGRE